VNRRRAALAALAAVAAVTLAGCTTIPTKRPGTISVVVGFYPIDFAAQQVGGSHLTITDLTKPGVEPHDVELTPQQVAIITTADVVAYIPGLAPAIDEAVLQNNPKAALDVTKGIQRLSANGDGAAPCPPGARCPYLADPHVWLDPLNEAQIGRNLTARFTQLLPEQAAAFQSGITNLNAAMQGLNKSYSAGTASCESRTLVASHAAFGYLAHAYNLTQIGISGLNPDAEPSPARMAEVAALAKKYNVSTIYYERLVSPAVANTLAATLGLTTAVLDPLEGAPPQGNYTTQMQANLGTLITGQRCS
jgi:zinc transport system substrate-binding protein